MNGDRDSETGEWGLQMSNCPTPMTSGEKKYWATVLTILTITVGSYIMLLFYMFETAA